MDPGSHGDRDDDWGWHWLLIGGLSVSSKLLRLAFTPHPSASLLSSPTQNVLWEKGYPPQALKRAKAC